MVIGLTQLKNYVITQPTFQPPPLPQNKQENKNTSPKTWFIILLVIRIFLLWALGPELDTF